MNASPHWAVCPHPTDQLFLLREHPTVTLNTYRCTRCHGIVIASFDLAVLTEKFDALDRLTTPST